PTDCTAAANWPGAPPSTRIAIRPWSSISSPEKRSTAATRSASTHSAAASSNASPPSSRAEPHSHLPSPNASSTSTSMTSHSRRWWRSGAWHKAFRAGGRSAHRVAGRAQGRGGIVERGIADEHVVGVVRGDDEERHAGIRERARERGGDSGLIERHGPGQLQTAPAAVGDDVRNVAFLADDRQLVAGARDGKERAARPLRNGVIGMQTDDGVVAVENRERAAHA